MQNTPPVRRIGAGGSRFGVLPAVASETRAAAAAFVSAYSASMVVTAAWAVVAAAAAFFLLPDDRPRPEPAAR